MVVVCCVVASAACTKKNPAAVCHDGNCTDPAFPFCDVDGTIGGAPGACIAVTCSAGMFGECRDANTALTCNASGTNFDITQCQLGCDPAAGGCRLCQPNQTECANGVTQTCDANGAVVSSQTCPLGCFQSEPRCRDIDPSNGFGTYLDMVASPPDIDIPAGSTGTLDTRTGMLTVDAVATMLPSFSLTNPGEAWTWTSSSFTESPSVDD